MSIYQLLRYSVDFMFDGVSNGYTLTTIHKLKPCVSLPLSGFHESIPRPIRRVKADLRFVIPPKVRTSESICETLLDLSE